MIELGAVDIRVEDDVVRAHQATRSIAAQLGYSTFEQTRIATATSEIVRNALLYGHDGTVTFGLDDDRTSLSIVVIDHGTGIPELPAILAGQRRSTTGLGVGIPGARRLMDGFEIVTGPRGTRVELSKRLPRRAVEGARDPVTPIRDFMSARLADDPRQEMGRLMRDIAERDQRLAEITEELAETNRGVMALHGELEARAEYQRQALELRTRLVSEMGHEVRTPLHSVLSISQFLLERLDGELTVEQAKQVTLIHDITETLTSYVNDLLDLARSDAGKARLQLGEVAPAALLRTLRRVMTPLARNPDVELSFEVPPALPTMITDEGKLAQILRNLVGNALKFTSEGRVVVCAGAGAQDTMTFEVSDTGVGIAEEHQAVIFEEFAQVDGPQQARVRGSGLGLPLSRRLTELLGGTLTVRSELGSGSRFLLTLPRQLTGPLEQATALAPAPAPVRPVPGRARVLIIDDDQGSRYVLRRWLDSRYQVDEAGSGQDGLRQAAAHPPHAIFLDVVMPDLTGFEVLDQLKADPRTRDVPVVVYSGLVLGKSDTARLSAAVAILRKSTASRVADRVAIEDALLKAGLAEAPEPGDRA